MNKHTLKKALAASLMAAVIATGCHKTELKPANHSTIIDGKDYTTWQFIEDVSRDYYLWTDQIPRKLNYTSYKTPQEFFNKAIRYKDDRFSTIVDNYAETESYFDNDMLTDGLNLELYLADNSDENVIALVNYVYKDTPAYGSGIRRGCVIEQINGETITINNYNDLLDLPACTYTYSYSKMDDDGSFSYGDEYHTTDLITKADCKVEPVLVVKNGETGGHKYGYMAYDAFTSDTKCIMDAVAELQKNNPSDLILDLRLNGGGYVTTLDTLASMLVPDGNVGKVFLESKYNKELSDYYRETEGEDFAYERFVEISPKLNLKNLYVIISGNSASASEELISGLMPYMNVVLIGEQSYGKFTSNILLNNDIDGTDDDGIPYRDWAEYVSIGSCANSLGEMNFKDGFQPDYEIHDPIYGDLGDADEPLMQAALQLISGTLAKKSQAIPARKGMRLTCHGKPEITRGAMIMQARNR